MGKDKREDVPNAGDLVGLMALAVGIGTGSSDQAVDTANRIATSHTDNHSFAICGDVSRFASDNADQALDLLRTKLGWTVDESKKGSCINWVQVTLPAGWTATRTTSAHTQIHDDKGSSRGMLFEGDSREPGTSLLLDPRFYVPRPGRIKQGENEVVSLALHDAQAPKDCAFVACRILMPNLDAYDDNQMLRKKIIDEKWGPLNNLTEALKGRIEKLFREIFPEYSSAFAYWNEDMSEKLAELKTSVAKCVEELAERYPMFKEALVSADEPVSSDLNKPQPIP
jgi:hypothetical protein